MAACIPAFPQSASGLIRGTISDQSGAPIPTALVKARRSDGNEKTAVSGADGRYVLNGLAPGQYTVVAELPSFQQLEPAVVTVSSGPVTLNVTLVVASSKQEITVQDSSAPVVSTDPAQNASALVMHGEDLDALSDDPDDLQSDLEALAGPAAGPNGGSFYIDGFTAGDAPLPNKNAIREIRVNQNPFSPEFDAIGFGRVEILTKPGADSFRGTAGFTYDNDAMNSRNPYAIQKPPFNLKEYTGTLGGPLGKKLSFFSDFDDRDIANGSILNAVILNPSSLAVISPYTQVFNTPIGRLRFSSRLDYQLNTNNVLQFRYTFYRNVSSNAGVGNFSLASQAYNSTYYEHDLEGTETAILSPKAINETRFQFRHQNSRQSPEDQDPAVVVSNAFTAGGALSGLHNYIHHHYEVQNYTTITANKQTWKFGIRLRAVDVQDWSAQNFNGTFTFGGAYAPELNAGNLPLVPGIVCNANAPQAGCATISSIEQYRRTLLFEQMGLPPSQVRLLGGGATQFSINTGGEFVHTGGWNIGLFVGDDWRLLPNLTVSLGLRYETQDNIPDHADWAPRIGFAWSPGSSSGGHSKYVIRGGFGIFYDRFDEQNVLMVQRYNGITQQQYVIPDPDTFPDVPSTAGLQQFAQAQTVHTIASSLHAPYVLQSALGLERQLASHTTLSLNYVNTHGLHELLSRDINAPLPGTYGGVPGTGIFPYGNVGPIDEIESAGLFNQNQFTINVNSQLNSKVSLFGFYALGYARSNTDGVNFYPANQYDLRTEYGPASTDVRNRSVIGGSVAVKWGFKLSPFVSLQSGLPFNIVSSEDEYGDTLLTARPGIVTDPSLPGVITTRYGLLDPNPAPGEEILPRNFGRGPGQVSVNLRVSKTFGFGPDVPGSSSSSTIYHRYNLTFSLSARNALNHVNPGQVVGNINSPFFGESTQIAGGSGAYGGSSNNRRLELQARFSF